MRSLARELLPCDEKCVTAASPAETCRCTACLGVHHGVHGRHTTLHQVELFSDATGADDSRPESQHSELPPELHRDGPATAGVDGGGVTTWTGVGRDLPGPAAEGPQLTGAGPDRTRLDRHTAPVEIPLAVPEGPASAHHCGCGRVHLTPPITPLCECGKFHRLRYRGRCAHCLGH